MKLEATIKKDGKFWLVEVKSLGPITQGLSKREAKAMLQDWFESSLKDPSKVRVTVDEPTPGRYFVEFHGELKQVFALLFQRQRMNKGYSVREVAKLLKFKSPNSYAQYEQAKAEPSVTQAEKILEVLDPDNELKIAIG